MNDLSKTIEDAIEKNKLVVFVGAGLSSRFNLPTWESLVKDVIRETESDDLGVFIPVLDKNRMSPLEILDKMTSEHNAIRKYISSKFRVGDCDFSTHVKILELCGRVITTNYDDAFEKACNNAIVPSIWTSTFNISEINKSTDPYILKLHGSVTEPDHCLVFTEDYKRLYSESTPAIQKLKSIFSESTILFIGFSFTDPAITSLFDTLDRVFLNNNRHVILTKTNDGLDKYKYLERILISEFTEIDTFLDKCLDHKRSKISIEQKPIVGIKKALVTTPRFALLQPNPIDLPMKDEIGRATCCFDNLMAEIYHGALNIRTLTTIDDFDILIIVTKTFKSNVYIEDDNLKSNMLTVEEMLRYVPNERLLVILITDEKVPVTIKNPVITVASLRHSVVNRFVFKVLRNGNFDFSDEDVINANVSVLPQLFLKGQARNGSIYGERRDLSFGKKSFNIIGRVEEQAIMAARILGVTKTNKLLNIKASGGIGKTSLVKKVSYELYNRGYFRDGVTFGSCETIRSFGDFEELVINCFQMSNILDFTGHLVENYRASKLDLLVILDNFETITNCLLGDDLTKAIDLVKFITDYASIVVTSRERISALEDFEDVYSLTPMITDDALNLFQSCYGKIENPREVEILRSDILEDLLNNNPLAIKLVVNSRVRFQSITELRQMLKQYFFESINEDFSIIFSDDADLNIERKKSIYQSINYSYATLNEHEKLAFELLNLFPDGISLVNFKKCFEKRITTNGINDKDLRHLRDKSLIEDYDGILQLQPIIRRFAEFQFAKRAQKVKNRYSVDAYIFNCYVLKIIETVEKGKSVSDALKLHSKYKNNMLKVLTYLPDIEITKKGPVRHKKYLLNYIYAIDDYVINEKQVAEFHDILSGISPYFSDIPNADLLIKALDYNKVYYYQEFDNSYKHLSQLLSIDDMEKRVFSNEDYIERRYKNIVANIYSMEGFTLRYVKSHALNNYLDYFLVAQFFYLGIVDSISRKNDEFYHFEYELMFNALDTNKLKGYINQLHLDQHLEKMQCTYTLSKVTPVDRKDVQRLVVSNPYSNGLKQLMFAFIEPNDDEKIKYFESALRSLSHIKYYYLEALYYYCLFLKELDLDKFNQTWERGMKMSRDFRFQYLNFLFENIHENPKPKYEFSYRYYELEELESFVNKHNEYWAKEFSRTDLN